MIPILEWNDSFNTGVSIVDTQHQGLFDLRNELASAILIEETTTVISTLTKMFNYADLHFKTEEKFLKEHSEFDIHKKKHGDFLIKTQVFTRDLFKDKETASSIIQISVLDFLTDWLGTHVLKYDKKVFEQLFERGLL